MGSGIARPWQTSRVVNNLCLWPIETPAHEQKHKNCGGLSYQENQSGLDLASPFRRRRNWWLNLVVQRVSAVWWLSTVRAELNSISYLVVRPDRALLRSSVQSLWFLWASSWPPPQTGSHSHGTIFHSVFSNLPASPANGLLAAVEFRSNLTFDPFCQRPLGAALLRSTEVVVQVRVANWVDDVLNFAFVLFWNSFLRNSVWDSFWNCPQIVSFCCEFDLCSISTQVSFLNHWNFCIHPTTLMLLDSITTCLQDPSFSRVFTVLEFGSSENIILCL